VEWRLIFHLSFSVCRLSLWEEAVVAMTNEKWQTENGKSKCLKIFPALLKLITRRFAA
jgi:hypothetical protein